MFVSLPAAVRACFHLRLSANPPSMQASLDPIVETPIVVVELGAFQRVAIIVAQRTSIAALAGYSSLSIMFLSAEAAIILLAFSSIHVVTNVARFKRAFPSNIASSITI